MPPKLEAAYKMILEFERLKKIKLHSRKSIENEIDDIQNTIEDHITSFNENVVELTKDVKNLSLEEFENRWVHIRLEAMNIETDFRNFVDEIDAAFQQAQ